MVQINQSKLEEYLKEIENTPELKRCKTFVENFFNTFGNQTLEQAYMNYMNDILMYAPTNKCIDQNRTYLCWIFMEVTGASLEELAEIEYKHHGPPKIHLL